VSLAQQTIIYSQCVPGLIVETPSQRISGGMETTIEDTEFNDATLFSIAMNSILKKLELRGNISTRLKQCTAYADDI
jgi:hypothetical protein